MTSSTTTDSLLSCCDNYILIDVGANITNKKFLRDIDSVVQRAKESGIQKIIVPGSSIKSAKEALRLAKFHPGTVYATAGIHPFEAKSWEESQMLELQEILQDTECVAVGEIGLDYTKDFSPRDVQKYVFEKQVALACQLKKPIILHEKGAHEDVMEVLKKYEDTLPPLVFHSFVGTFDEAKSYLQFDTSYIAVSGYICKDNSTNGIQKLIESKALPLNRILVETDSPFLYPNARSSKLPTQVKSTFTQRSLKFLERYCTFQRNEPCSLPIIVEIVAGLMNKPAEEVALASTLNALKVFGLSS
ncbi:3'-5' ssDNA/RNA exonuclease TatD [Planococcus citri]|uniref:3'-5' ssDNA/RNA exonuclease TatD n=1 Tax=Planococcus citri TaxID=170843 RepID=UPI0031FA30A5